MNKFFDSAIALTSFCSLGLASLTLAEETISYEPPETLKDIQLQRLNNSLAANNKSFETLSPLPPKPPQSPVVSRVAIDIVKEFEGFKGQAYIDTDGTPVIGYGLSAIDGKSVQIGDRISPEAANSALNSHLQTIQQELADAITVDLSEEQLSAVVSLSFNAGVHSIEQSTLVRKINAGDYYGAADEFLRWDKANVRGTLVRLPGLTRRRQAERQLFLQGIDRTVDS